MMNLVLEKIKKLTMVFSAIVLFSALGAASASASTVTRSFSTAAPQAGSPLTVTLAVDVLSPDTLYLIDEIFPAGWVVSNAGTGDLGTAGHIKWIVTSGAVSANLQYSVTVPATALGVNLFSGEFAFDNTPSPLPQILGSVSVDIQAAPVAPVLTSITVTPTTVNLAPGGTQQLTATALDQNSAPVAGATISWLSSNPAAVTVSATGLVTAVGAGTSTVTATATSGLVTVSNLSNVTVAVPVLTSTVTRSFSTATPAPGSALTVSLAVNMIPTDTFYIIDEIVPAGWVVTSSTGTGDFTSQAGHVKWAVLSGAVSTALQYTATAPAALGAHNFSGEFSFDSTPVPSATMGAASVTVTAIVVPPVVPPPPVTPPPPASGGGGGGGGGFIFTPPVATTAPSNVSIVINNGKAEALSRHVVLDISATGASEMKISNTADFAGAIYEPFRAVKPWTVENGEGLRTVYAKFRNSAGESAAVSDSIMKLEDNPASFTPVRPPQVSAPTAPGQVLGVVKFNFTKNLSRGMQNNDVLELQKRLAEEGHYKGPMSGFFGSMTAQAVMDYQVKNGMGRIGVVGPNTRAKLNSGISNSGPSANSGRRMIRQEGDHRIFEIDDNGVKHHLNMTADDFVRSGRRFEKVEVVDAAEVGRHGTGDDILGTANLSGRRLIRQQGDHRIFEIDDNGVRHHLNMTADDFIRSGRRFEKVEVVDAAEIGRHGAGDDIVGDVRQEDRQQDRALERALGDDRVFEIDDNGVRHHLNMTADDFIRSGRRFENVKVVEPTEILKHNAGDDIIAVNITAAMQAQAGIVITGGVSGPGYPTGKLNLTVPSTQLLLDRIGQVKANGTQLEVKDRQYEIPLETIPPTIASLPVTINGVANTANEIKVISNLKTDNGVGQHSGSIDVDIDVLPAAGHVTLQYSGTATVTGSTIVSKGTFKTSKTTGIFTGLVAEGTYDMTIVESGNVQGSPATVSITTVSP